MDALQKDGTIPLKYINNCVDFIQGAWTESLNSQVQGASTHPPHP